MNGSITFLVNFWAYQFVHLLILKSSVTVVSFTIVRCIILGKDVLQYWSQDTFHNCAQLDEDQGEEVLDDSTRVWDSSHDLVCSHDDIVGQSQLHHQDVLPLVRSRPGHFERLHGKLS